VDPFSTKAECIFSTRLENNRRKFMFKMKLKVLVEDDRFNGDSEEFLKGKIVTSSDPKEILEKSKEKAQELLKRAYFDWKWEPEKYPAKMLIRVPKKHPEILKLWLNGQSFEELSKIVAFQTDLEGNHVSAVCSYHDVMYEHKPKVIFSVGMDDSLFNNGEFIHSKLKYQDVKKWAQWARYFTNKKGKLRNSVLKILAEKYGIDFLLPIGPWREPMERGDVLIVAIPLLSGEFSFSLWRMN